MVWYVITEEGYDKYIIVMFYENEYNKADGEDFIILERCIKVKGVENLCEVSTPY